MYECMYYHKRDTLYSRQVEFIISIVHHPTSHVNAKTTYDNNYLVVHNQYRTS